MTSIRSWIYPAALLACLLGILLTTHKPTTNLGNGFSAEGGRPFAAVGSRGTVIRAGNTFIGDRDVTVKAGNAYTDSRGTSVRAGSALIGSDK